MLGSIGCPKVLRLDQYYWQGTRRRSSTRPDNPGSFATLGQLPLPSTPSTHLLVIPLSFSALAVASHNGPETPRRRCRRNCELLSNSTTTPTTRLTNIKDTRPMDHPLPYHLRLRGLPRRPDRGHVPSLHKNRPERTLWIPRRMVPLRQRNHWRPLP